MAKVDLIDVTLTGSTLVSAINTNNDRIETAMEKTLSRDGTAPNSMESNLDMNSHRILNLPDPINLHETATKHYVDELAFPDFSSVNISENAFATVADVEAATINIAVTYIQTLGYTTIGDGGGARYIRATTEPTHSGKLQSDDGAWWELIERHPCPEQFGGIPDYTIGGSGTDSTTAIQAAHDYAVATGCRSVQLFGRSGAYLVTDTIEGEPVLYWTRTGAMIVFKDMSGKDGISFTASTAYDVLGGIDEGITLVAEGANLVNGWRTAKSGGQYLTYRTQYVFRATCRGAVADTDKYQSAYDYTAEAWARVGDCTGLIFAPGRIQGAWDIKSDPSGQTEDCALVLDAASAILKADIWLPRAWCLHTMMKISNKAFFTVHDGYDGAGLHDGIIDDSDGSLLNEPRIGKGNLNVQRTGIYIASDSREVDGATIRRHKDGWKSATHEWNAIYLNGVDKAYISNCEAQPDESGGAFTGDQNFVHASGGSSIICSGNVPAQNIDNAFIFDGTAGFEVESTSLAGTGTGQTYVNLKTSARRGIIEKPTIASASAAAAYTLIAHDGSIDWTTIEADECLGLRRLPAATELTIASGVVTATQSFHTIDTESDASSDDLDTITPSAWMTTGTMLHLRAASSSRTISVTEAGNIHLVSAPRALTHSGDWLALVYENGTFKEVSFADNDT